MIANFLQAEFSVDLHMDVYFKNICPKIQLSVKYWDTLGHTGKKTNRRLNYM